VIQRQSKFREMCLALDVEEQFFMLKLFMPKENLFINPAQLVLFASKD
jgi:hypothetical protein